MKARYQDESFEDWYRRLTLTRKRLSNKECSRILHEYHKHIYQIEYEITNFPDGRTSENLWMGWADAMSSQYRIIMSLNEGTLLPPPAHMVVLMGEIANLCSRIPARLLRVDGASLGDNSRSAMRLGMQMSAAAFLRRFMDRDGWGSQKAAAEAVAKALNAAGIAPPGRGDKSYTARTVEGWLRQASADNGQFSQHFQQVLAMQKRLGGAFKLEEELAALAETIKAMAFEPNDPMSDA